MGFEIKSIASNRNIYECLVVQEVFENGEKIVLMVVPAQTVLLRLRGCHSHSQAQCDMSREMGRILPHAPTNL